MPLTLKRVIEAGLLALRAERIIDVSNYAIFSPTDTNFEQAWLDIVTGNASQNQSISQMSQEDVAKLRKKLGSEKVALPMAMTLKDS